MEECGICYEEKNEYFKLSCSHKLCTDCYDRISNTCPFCRHPIKAKIEEEINEFIYDDDPEYWLEYDQREWVTYSRFMRNGNEIIRTFRRSEVPDDWRNDDLTMVLKRRRQRRRRMKN
jgi:hypothetical protein